MENLYRFKCCDANDKYKANLDEDISAIDMLTAIKEFVKLWPNTTILSVTLISKGFRRAL